MPPTTSGMSVDPLEGDRQYICPIDQYIMALDPNHQPRSEEMLLRTVRARAPTSDFEKAWKLYTAAANRVVDRLKSKRAVADKPIHGDPSVKYYDIPDSKYVIRLWDGCMQQYGLYCFDLYDLSERTAVNLPHDYKICNAPPAMIGDMGTEVMSWEAAWGISAKEIRPGQERFAVPEGSHLALVRPGKPLFFFALPIRPRLFGGVRAVYAQPRN